MTKNNRTGHVIVGGTLSVTVTVTDVAAAQPFASVTVKLCTPPLGVNAPVPAYGATPPLALIVILTSAAHATVALVRLAVTTSGELPP